MESSVSTQNTAGLVAEGTEDVASDWLSRLSFPAMHITWAHASLVKVTHRAQPVISGIGNNTPRGLREQHL